MRPTMPRWRRSSRVSPWPATAAWSSIMRRTARRSVPRRSIAPSWHAGRFAAESWARTNNRPTSRGVPPSSSRGITSVPETTRSGGSCRSSSSTRTSIPRPETRDPKNYRVFREHGLDLQAYVLRERPRLVSAALTLLRGFLAADATPAKLTAIDFPEWERLVRQAVHFATGFDPCGSRKDLAADDETMGERTRLVNAWAA